MKLRDARNEIQKNLEAHESKQEEYIDMLEERAETAEEEEPEEEKKEEEEIHVEIPKAEEIGTSLGDLFKGLKLD